METMQEILSNAVDPNAPVAGQEFYELRIEDSDEVRSPGFVVSQAHAQWSEIARRIIWDDAETEQCVTYEIARARYEARRRALVEKGFVYLNVDPPVGCI